MKKIILFLVAMVPLIANAQQELVSGSWMSHYVPSKATAYAFTPSTNTTDSLVVSYPADKYCKIAYIGIVSKPMKPTPAPFRTRMPILMRIDTAPTLPIIAEVGVTRGSNVIVIVPLFQTTAQHNKILVELENGSKAVFASSSSDDVFSLSGAGAAIKRAHNLCISNNAI